MKLNYKTKKILTNIGIVLLVVAVLGLLVNLISNRDNNNDSSDFTKVSLKWDVGAIEGGTFDEMQDTTMVTDYIVINEALKFDVAANKNVTYFISVYDENNNYLGDFENGCPQNNTQTITLAEFESEYAGANKVRLEITGMTGDDTHISIFEKGKYSKVISVYTTTKEQVTETTDGE